MAFECVLHEKLETVSRYVFIGRIVRLAARAGLIDTEAWRVNLRDYHPVARFGASFYTRTNDRFSLSDVSRASGRPQPPASTRSETTKNGDGVRHIVTLRAWASDGSLTSPNIYPPNEHRRSLRPDAHEGGRSGRQSPLTQVKTSRL